MMNDRDRLRQRIAWERVPGTGGGAVPGAVSHGADRASDSSDFAALVTHLRTGRRPVYLFDGADADAFSDPETVREADRILEHEILGHRFAGDIDWHFNATSGDTRDSEWTWSLTRHGFWIPLARAYRMTGDERYAREFVAQLQGFTTAWPMERYFDQRTADMSFPGDAWRSIEAGIRIYTVWLPAFVYFRGSPSWHEDGWVCFLNGLHDHAEFLCRHYSNHTRCSNWLTMESTALFQLGVLFPEFKRYEEWRRLGYRRICHEVRYQFDQDGVHIERTPIYHLVAAGAFLQAYRIAAANGIVAPPYMLPVLERSAEFLMRLVKPDFSLPMIGDADRVSLTDRRADRSPYEGMNLTTDPVDLNEVRAFFRVMAEIAGREDFRYFAEGRRAGREPDRRCWTMDASGYYVFRGGWGPTDSYFLVTGTQVERGSNAAHSHRDACHLELAVGGRDVLVDCGRYLYQNCSRTDWADYFLSTRAHNTVGVDGRDMGDLPDTPPEVRGIRSFRHRLEISEDFDLIELSHNGYAFLEHPVFHRRRVLHVKPSLWLVDDMLTGSGGHLFQLFFNFAPGGLEAVEALPHAYRYAGNPGSGDPASSCPDSTGPDSTGPADAASPTVDVLCIPLLTEGLESEVFEGSTEPKAGWVSYAYSVKEPAPQLVYSLRGTPPVRFLTALHPGGEASVHVRPAAQAGEVALSVSTGGRSLDVVLGTESAAVSEAER